MNIYLTNHADVRYTKFCTADGQIMYKSETPGFLHAGKKTTIYKVIPNDDPEDMSTLSHFHCVHGPFTKSTHSTSVDRFTELATIDWRVIKSSKLTYHGVEMPVATKGVFARWEHCPVFLCTTAGLIHDLVSTRQRIFTAPDDGRLFKWTLGVLRVTVSFDDKQ
jgi:hypothetical protein